jgi:hypothetical protein
MAGLFSKRFTPASSPPVRPRFPARALATLECAGMTALWDWETCLPVGNPRRHRAAWRAVPDCRRNKRRGCPRGRKVWRVWGWWGERPREPVLADGHHWILRGSRGRSPHRKQFSRKPFLPCAEIRQRRGRRQFIRRQCRFSFGSGLSPQIGTDGCRRLCYPFDVGSSDSNKKFNSCCENSPE